MKTLLLGVASAVLAFIALMWLAEPHHVHAQDAPYSPDEGLTWRVAHQDNGHDAGYNIVWDYEMQRPEAQKAIADYIMTYCNVITDPTFHYTDTDGGDHTISFPGRVVCQLPKPKQEIPAVDTFGQ
jgi:hypothetical protein